MLTQRDVGHRVAIRVIAGQRGGRALYSEIVGRLTVATPTELLIRTRTGQVTVQVGAVRAARRIPDRRALTATERLERTAAEGWPAPEREHLGDWLLRAAGGWTSRANSALAIGDPDLALPDAITAVEAWYAQRSLPPAITVPEPVGGRLTAQLRARGWQPNPVTLVQTADLATIVAASSDRIPSQAEFEQRLDEAPRPEWLAAVERSKNGLPPVARQVITGVPLARYAGIYPAAPAEPAPLAVARGVIAAEGRWLGISLVHTVGHARRHGLASALTGALARWAALAGASRAYLQVERDNRAAIELYARLGFATAHRYTTWRRLDPAGGGASDGSGGAAEP